MEDLLEFYNELMDEHIPSGNDGLNLIERRILLEVLNSTEDTENCRKLIINVLQRMRNKIDKYICRITCNDWLRYSLISGKGEFGDIHSGNLAVLPVYRDLSKKGLVSTFTPNLKGPKIYNFTKAELQNSDYNPFIEENREPLWLDSAFPNLLCNGSSDINDGFFDEMSEKIIFPHNINNICAVIDAVIDNPDISVEELVSIIEGPDFPTGGVIYSKDLLEIYKTGTGKINIRGKYIIQGNHIFITEVPYLSSNISIIKKLQNEFISEIESIYDESCNRNPVQINIELKKETDINFFVKKLENSKAFNKTLLIENKVLVDLEPKIVNLREMIDLYLNNRYQILQGTLDEKNSTIKAQLNALKEKYGDPRRTQIII
ncbi:MAG: hypothetical protein MJ179_01200 [Treponema sp.]|nr:hypothetical protein [Treponema sp.]